MGTKIRIAHLYPDLLNLYGDRGNIQCMRMRLLWRGYEPEVMEYNLGDSIDFSKADIVLLGGGSDREQMIVCRRLQEIQRDFKAYVEDNG
ncbi:MAG: glutamine amidotransferase, partial [Lachnospiraceae bacterium]|nr:glutamine amidotransferase [Lachnospiraceae bacterium]